MLMSRRQNCNRMVMLLKGGEGRTDLVFGMKRMFSRVHQRRELRSNQQQTRQKNNKLSMCMSQ